MKNRLKGLLALMLSLIMVFALATNAWGAVSIGGVDMGDGTTTTYYFNGANGETGTTSTDPSSNWNAKLENVNSALTLTLNNFSTEAGISAYGDLTISLEGANNTIKNTNGDGIYFAGGTLTISGAGTVDISGSNNGISATSGGANVVINSGTVSASGSNGHGIDTTTVTISGGTVNAKATGDDSVGINAGNTITIGGEGNPTVNIGCSVGLQAGTVKLNSNCTVIIDSDSNAVAGCNLDFGNNPYQWTNVNSNTATLITEPITNYYGGSTGNDYPPYLKLVVGTSGGGTPTPQPPIINWGGWVDTTPEEDPEKVEAATTFDGGIALSVAVTVLSATGGAWLAKKRED